jgi:hypothetical protein
VVVLLDGKQLPLQDIVEYYDKYIESVLVGRAKEMIGSRIEGTLKVLTDTLKEAEEKLLNAFGEAEEVDAPPEIPYSVWKSLLRLGLYPEQAKQAWALCRLPKVSDPTGIPETKQET